MSDFIRKSEAIKVIMEDDVCCYCSHTRLLREIKNLPTIEPNGVQKALCEQAYKEGQLSKMPKRGEWVDEADKYDASFGIHDYRCSNCNSYADEYIGGHEWYTAGKPNFCPHCGADMRKGADDETD